MRTLYPAIEPYVRHTIEVEQPHRVYVEECGNPGGIPVLFVLLVLINFLVLIFVVVLVGRQNGGFGNAAMPWVCRYTYWMVRLIRPNGNQLSSMTKMVCCVHNSEQTTKDQRN